MRRTFIGQLYENAYRHVIRNKRHNRYLTEANDYDDYDDYDDSSVNTVDAEDNYDVMDANADTDYIENMMDKQLDSDLDNLELSDNLYADNTDDTDLAMAEIPDKDYDSALSNFDVSDIYSAFMEALRFKVEMDRPHFEVTLKQSSDFLLEIIPIEKFSATTFFCNKVKITNLKTYDEKECDELTAISLNDIETWEELD